MGDGGGAGCCVHVLSGWACCVLLLVVSSMEEWTCHVVSMVIQMRRRWTDGRTDEGGETPGKREQLESMQQGVGRFDWLDPVAHAKAPDCGSKSGDEGRSSRAADGVLCCFLSGRDERTAQHSTMTGPM